MYARVALDLPVLTEFTYAVPGPMSAKLKPGQRVRVPFRHTTRIGYCVALEETTDLEKTREIAAILDFPPSCWRSGGAGPTPPARLPG